MKLVNSAPDFSSRGPRKVAIPGPYQVVAYAKGPSSAGGGPHREFTWGLKVDLEGRVLVAKYDESSQSWGPWIEQLVVIGPIRSAALDFDPDGYFVICFVRENKSLGVWCRTDTNLPQLLEVDTNVRPFVRTSRLHNFDSATRLNDTLLFYSKEGNTVFVSRLSNNFSLPKQMQVPTSRPTWVYDAGPTDKLNVQIQIRG